MTFCVLSYKRCLIFYLLRSFLGQYGLFSSLCQPINPFSQDINAKFLKYERQILLRIRKPYRNSSKSNNLSVRDRLTCTSFSRLPHFPEMEEKPFNLADLGQLGSCLCKYTGNYCILGVIIGQINDRKRSIKSRQNSASSQTSYGVVRLTRLAAHLADCAVPNCSNQCSR